MKYIFHIQWWQLYKAYLEVNLVSVIIEEMELKTTMISKDEPSDKYPVCGGRHIHTLLTQVWTDMTSVHNSWAIPTHTKMPLD